MSTLLLLILLAVVAVALGVGFLGFKSMSKRDWPAEPADPSGTHHTPPKSTAEKKARGET